MHIFLFFQHLMVLLYFLDNYLKKLNINEEEVVALSQYYKIEKVLADTLILLNADNQATNTDIDQDIDFYEQLNKIKMHEHQREAVKIAVNNGVSIITGGPGTGKTTIITS